ncbi:MAG: 3-methyl-2-oxobutanoate hydroxymethyltransferase [Candidatus Marinimicrobia bacterium]|nr:3-methyl-2-oxobutanoate hydroxymethyltransferase [Candidatus Neomarinimicrobiota bacterium]
MSTNLKTNAAPKPWTPVALAGLKGQRRLTCLSVHDHLTARLVDEAGIDIALVGDSLGMTVLGFPNTLPVSMADMLRHTAAVARACQTALVVADMPFMSYQVSVAQGLRNAGRFLSQAGASMVKIEGGAGRVELISALTANGIPVMGHIGLTPQSIAALGRYRVQGRTAPEAEQLLADARAVTAAGASLLVIECVPAPLARAITAAVSCPTIGIGAGPDCDGQVLVLADLLGLTPDPAPRFVRRYADFRTQAQRALAAYKADVASGAYPAEDESYA